MRLPWAPRAPGGGDLPVSSADQLVATTTPETIAVTLGGDERLTQRSGCPEFRGLQRAPTPAVLAAAVNRLGPRGAPLVCVEGQVRTAGRLLLDRLRGAGATLRYHGDFD